jgi:hypothetical protein
MMDKVPSIIKTLNHIGITMEYRVIKPSKNPAAIVKGTVPKNIFKPSLKPILKEFNLE